MFLISPDVLDNDIDVDYDDDDDNNDSDYTNDNSEVNIVNDNDNVFTSREYDPCTRAIVLCLTISVIANVVFNLYFSSVVA